MRIKSENKALGLTRIPWTGQLLFTSLLLDKNFQILIDESSLDWVNSLVSIFFGCSLSMILREALY